MKNEIGKIFLHMEECFYILLGKKENESRKQYIQYDSIFAKKNVYTHIHIYTSICICVLKSLRKSICQNISDYLWMVDFMGNFIFAISIFGNFDEHIS